jgi:NitT/TauT family transport system substrate-binding protein
MQIIPSRRTFMAGASAILAAALLGTGSTRAEGLLPETKTVRLPKIGLTDCQAAGYIVEELLHGEGFTDVRFVTPKDGGAILLGSGELDFDINFVPFEILSIERGIPAVMLAGLHSGCLELIANETVQSVKDLKGKRVGVDKYDSHPHVLLKIMASYIGLDPETDIQWVVDEKASPMELFARGNIDALLTGPPETHELRDRKVGHTILNTVSDHPWSHYFCCMLVGSKDYVTSYPAATRRVLRAIFKAADLCTSSPEWIAQQMVERGFAERYDYVLRTLKEIRYTAWRDLDPEDSVRFFALRLNEVGLLRASPHAVNDQAADWHFVDELKRELKA